MRLAKALKVKNRMAGEINRLKQIFQRENARRNDNVSKVDRQAVWEEILRLSDELGVLKGKIAAANIGIYPALERMAELKGRIAYVASLRIQEGEETEYMYSGREQIPVKFTWDSFIGREKADGLAKQLQEEINDLQDKVDEYNATTDIDH